MVTCPCSSSSIRKRASPPRPTSATRPQGASAVMASRTAEEAPEVSTAAAAPGPPVSSLIASTEDVVVGSTVATAPNARACMSRSSEGSTATTSAPRAVASMVADKPTGPCPKMAMVEPPTSPKRSSAPQAVPVPHPIVAPASKLSPVVQGHQARHGHLQQRSMSSVNLVAQRSKGESGAHLRPPGATAVALRAADVVVDRDAVTHREASAPPRTNRRDHSRRFVTRDSISRCLGTPCRRAVDAQVAAAHARGAHCNDGLARAWLRVGEGSDINSAVPGEYCTFHGSALSIPQCVCRVGDQVTMSKYPVSDASWSSVQMSSKSRWAPARPRPGST